MIFGKMIIKMLRPIRNAIGSSKGYGACLCCGDRWNWKDQHDIDLTGDKGGFAVCEECWQTKSDDEILRATRKLILLWRDESEVALMVEKTREALKERKKVE